MKYLAGLFLMLTITAGAQQSTPCEGKGACLIPEPCPHGWTLDTDRIFSCKVPPLPAGWVRDEKGNVSMPYALYGTGEITPPLDGPKCPQGQTCDLVEAEIEKLMDDMVEKAQEIEVDRATIIKLATRKQ